jgi:polyphosphate:AMP phosphotransferase
MLERLDLSRKLTKAEFKAAREGLELELAALQRLAKERGLPVIILFEGWGASGKGTMINNLIMPLDPRGFTVHSTLRPTEEEALRPFLWRFWTQTPARGRIAIFDRSWYRQVVRERIEGDVKGKALAQAFQDIAAFERQLASDGAVIVKFLLHISRGEQRKRFQKLRDNPATSWRVTKQDLRDQRQYDQFLAAYEDMLAKSDADYAPWTVVEAHDERFATTKIFRTVIAALKTRLEAPPAAPVAKPARRQAAKPAPAEPATDLGSSILAGVDLSLAISEAEYDGRLDRLQDRLRELEHEIYRRRIPLVLVFEGWDAAGKGGCIRRLCRHLDPRGYGVVPIAAPNDVEKLHHYLWRFWLAMPKGGHIGIYDRSWYGRVLVERIEGFCSEAEWRRAYREINEMEQHMANAGTLVLKFWLHLDADEQLRRFQEREQDEHKQWKITEEDYRNRAKRDDYCRAVDEMLLRTDSPHAPWIVVEANCKRHARIKVLETVIATVEQRLDGKPHASERE